MAVNVYSQSSGKTFANYDSLSTSIDTLSRMYNGANYNQMYNIYKQYFQFWVLPDSAILVSTTSSFASDSTVLIKANEPYLSPLYNLSVLNVYFKVKGVGKCLKRIQQWGY